MNETKGTGNVKPIAALFGVPVPPGKAQAAVKAIKAAGNLLIPIGRREFLMYRFGPCPLADCPMCVEFRKFAQRN